MVTYHVKSHVRVSTPPTTMRTRFLAKGSSNEPIMMSLAIERIYRYAMSSESPEKYSSERLLRADRTPLSLG